jgi:hypothetical protein
MSQDETIPSDARPEPVLQPMKIVGEYVPAPVFNPGVIEDGTAAPGQPPARTAHNPLGKKLNMSRREIEAAARMKARPPNPFPIKSTEEIQLANQTRIDDLDRNTRSGDVRVSGPVYDMDWLDNVGGLHITTAWVHSAISISGFVSSETTLTATNLKLQGLTMSWQQDLGGLLCKIQHTGGIKMILIPAANIRYMTFE